MQGLTEINDKTRVEVIECENLSSSVAISGVSDGRFPRILAL